MRERGTTSTALIANN
jgi:hypothetical protein